MNNTSRLIGGTMLVAGTSIGAAMIAMPISASRIGFLYSCILLIITAAVMYYVAHITLQIYRITESDSTVARIAGKVLGTPFKFLCSAMTLILLLSLMVAYISGIGEMIADAVNIEYKEAIVAIAFGLCASLGISHQIFDYYNRIAFGLKVIFMSLVTVILLPNTSTDLLIKSSTNIHYDFSILSILPVFITSFGFHAGIPFIFKFLNRDKTLYYKTIVYGIGITLLIYVIWLTMSFGIVNEMNVNLADFIDRLHSGVSSPILHQSIRMFMILAIFTSLIGVATSVFDFIEESLRDIFNFENRFITSILTFFIPFTFTITKKSLFIQALGFAGCALTIIAILIPALIRFKLKSDAERYSPMLLMICVLIGILTIIGEVMML